MNRKLIPQKIINTDLGTSLISNIITKTTNANVSKVIVGPLNAPAEIDLYYNSQRINKPGELKTSKDIKDAIRLKLIEETADLAPQPRAG